MKIYFACSITGGREFESVYQAIVHALVEDGQNILTAHLAESSAMESEAALSPVEVYSRDVNWIRECDILIAEVSVPSHGVGYEVGFALSLGKPVLALFRMDRKVTKMISGNPDPNLVVRKYDSIPTVIELTRGFVSKKR